MPLEVLGSSTTNVLEGEEGKVIVKYSGDYIDFAKIEAEWNIPAGQPYYLGRKSTGMTREGLSDGDTIDFTFIPRTSRPTSTTNWSGEVDFSLVKDGIQLASTSSTFKVENTNIASTAEENKLDDVLSSSSGTTSVAGEIQQHPVVTSTYFDPPQITAYVSASTITLHLIRSSTKALIPTKTSGNIVTANSCHL